MPLTNLLRLFRHYLIFILDKHKSVKQMYEIVGRADDQFNLMKIEMIPCR